MGGEQVQREIGHVIFDTDQKTNRNGRAKVQWKDMECSFSTWTSAYSCDRSMLQGACLVQVTQVHWVSFSLSVEGG